jgi:hypothetical protein
MAIPVIAGLLAAGCAATPSDSRAPASAEADPRPTPASLTPPALTETFVSTIHGISIAYPSGWLTRAATEPWTADWPRFDDAFGDVVYDGSQTDHLFLGLASQPLGGVSGERWVADRLALQDDCAATAPVTIDGATGVRGVGCPIALVATRERGYLIWLYTSLEDQVAESLYDDSFEDILATVRLRPEDAS